MEWNDIAFELLSTDGTTDGTAAGRDFLGTRNYKRWMVEAGFVDVVEDVMPYPGMAAHTLNRSKIRSE